MNAHALASQQAPDAELTRWTQTDHSGHQLQREDAMERPTGVEIISVLVPALMLLWCLAAVV